MCFPDEVNEQLHFSRLENDMVKLKLYQADEINKTILREKLDSTNGVSQYVWN